MSESDTIFNEQDRRCTALQLMLFTDPSYDNSTVASTLKMQILIATNNRGVPRVLKTKFPATVMVFGVVSREGHIMTPHIFEVSLKVNTKVYLDMLKSVVIPWCSGAQWQTLDVAAGPQVQRDPGLASEGVLRLVPFSHCFTPPPTWTNWTTSFGRESHQHDLPQHQSQPDRRHPPSIHRAPTGAYRSGMLPVPDLYRDGDWGWRRLHWIDVSSTT